MKKIIVILLCILVLPPLAFSQTDQASVDSCKKATKPFICVKKLAVANNMIAQNKLGIMYEYGKGVLKDYKQAVYWFTKSAKQGNTEAQYNLGGMYAFGQGVEKSYSKAYAWWSISYNNGYSKASKGLELVDEYMSSDERNQGQALTKELTKTIKKAKQ